MNSEQERIYSLNELDKIIPRRRRSFDYSLSDAILLLLYARDAPIKGKTRQMKEAFHILTKVLAPYIAPVPFEKHKFGPYSEEVEYTIDNLVQFNYVSTTGSKRTNDYALRITQKGKDLIRNKFYELPSNVQEVLKERRKQFDSLTPKGILNFTYTHDEEYLEKSVFRKRHPKLDWSDDNQLAD